MSATDTSQVTKIDKHIKAVSIVDSSKSSTPAPARDATTPFMPSKGINEKVKRPYVLPGRTYKLTTPLSTASLYITMNDIVLNEGTDHASVHPFEIFINSRDMQNYQWVVALTLMVSAIFRKGGDVKFIVDELRSVFDPAGGYFTRRGKIPSLIAEIGYVIEDHFKSIGLIQEEEDPAMKSFIEEKRSKAVTDSAGEIRNARPCTKCHQVAVVVVDNCPTCLECGDSKCG